MFKILALWSCSRSRSTAFERMMLERGDFVIYHEPFGPYYYHKTRHLRYVEIDPNREVSFEKIFEELLQKSGVQRIFIKDFPWHFWSRVDEQFLELFHHTFLIRHPVQAIGSYLSGWQDVRAEELGYQELGQMFDLVHRYQKSPPVVINADDLVNNPVATVKSYCEAVDIPFLPKALSWDAKKREEFIYVEGGSWHKHLNSSSGFQAGDNEGYPTMENNLRMRELVPLVMPYYENMNNYRLSL